MEKKDELVKIFSLRIRSVLEKVDIEFDRLQEIRLRIQCPIILIYNNQEFFLTADRRLSSEMDKTWLVQKNDIKEMLEYIANYSLYAFQDEMKQGFITIQGGHRVGIAGKTVMDGDKVKSLKYISYINVRLSHQIRGCADRVLPYVADRDRVHHTLLISPPRCGKTTLLRDMIRQLSDGIDGKRGYTVGVVDERSEIGGCYLGVPQNDLGIRTDILDCCPKAEGMVMLLRSMAPEIIAVDEIGQYQDIQAIEYVINCGCKLIATVHGSSIEDIKQKPLLEKLVKEKIFERYIILHNRGRVGTIKEIFDSRGTVLYKGDDTRC